MQITLFAVVEKETTEEEELTVTNVYLRAKKKNNFVFKPLLKSVHFALHCARLRQRPNVDCSGGGGLGLGNGESEKKIVCFYSCRQAGDRQDTTVLVAVVVVQELYSKTKRECKRKRERERRLSASNDSSSSRFTSTSA